MMHPRIETISEKKLIGQRLTMTLAANRTFELWHRFMSRRKEITSNLSGDLISMEIYDRALDFSAFGPDTSFEKWAAVEVADFANVPSAMETYTLPGGLYAVFLYHGHPNDFEKMFHHIFGSWLPSSEWELDQREHFEVMGERYKNNDPDSEEEIWIPIRPKNI